MISPTPGYNNPIPEKIMTDDEVQTPIFQVGALRCQRFSVIVRLSGAIMGDGA